MAYGDNLIASAEAAVTRGKGLALRLFLTFQDRADLLVAAQRVEDALHGVGTPLEHFGGWRTCAQWSGTPSLWAKFRLRTSKCDDWLWELQQALQALAAVVARLQPSGAEDAEVVASTAQQVETAREQVDVVLSTKPKDRPKMPLWLKAVIIGGVVLAAGWLARPWGVMLANLTRERKPRLLPAPGRRDHEPDEWQDHQQGYQPDVVPSQPSPVPPFDNEPWALPAMDRDIGLFDAEPAWTEEPTP